MQQNRHWLRVTQSLIAAAFIFACAAGVSAQNLPQGQSPSNPDPTAKKSDDARFGSPEAEMRSKLAIKEEKKRYDENLARAKEVSELATQLNDGYLARKSFNADDNKRLERLEKLTKRIRNEAGGSESEPDPSMKDICAKMEDTMKNLADVAEELNKLVEKTPRNVISAAVIDQANRLIAITQHLRSGRQASNQ